MSSEADNHDAASDQQCTDENQHNNEVVDVPSESTMSSSAAHVEVMSEENAPEPGDDVNNSNEHETSALHSSDENRHGEVADAPPPASYGTSSSENAPSVDVNNPNEERGEDQEHRDRQNDVGDGERTKKEGNDATVQQRQQCDVTEQQQSDPQQDSAEMLCPDTQQQSQPGQPSTNENWVTVAGSAASHVYEVIDNNNKPETTALAEIEDNKSPLMSGESHQLTDEQPPTIIVGEEHEQTITGAFVDVNEVHRPDDETTSSSSSPRHGEIPDVIVTSPSSEQQPAIVEEHQQTTGVVGNLDEVPRPDAGTTSSSSPHHEEISEVIVTPSSADVVVIVRQRSEEQEQQQSSDPPSATPPSSAAAGLADQQCGDDGGKVVEYSTSDTCSIVVNSQDATLESRHTEQQQQQGGSNDVPEETSQKSDDCRLQSGSSEDKAPMMMMSIKPLHAEAVARDSPSEEITPTASTCQVALTTAAEAAAESLAVSSAAGESTASRYKNGQLTAACNDGVICCNETATFFTVVVIAATFLLLVSEGSVSATWILSSVFLSSVVLFILIDVNVAWLEFESHTKHGH